MKCRKNNPEAAGRTLEELRRKLKDMTAERIRAADELMGFYDWLAVEHGRSKALASLSREDLQAVFKVGICQSYWCEGCSSFHPVWQVKVPACKDQDRTMGGIYEDLTGESGTITAI